MIRDRLFIVMEFLPCNLLELLEAQPGGMDRDAVRLIMFQLCSAIAFIHSKVQRLRQRLTACALQLWKEAVHGALCQAGQSKGRRAHGPASSCIVPHARDRTWFTAT
jgi:hypothetical protein